MNIYLILGISLAFIVLVVVLIKTRKLKEIYPYVKRDDFLTKTEKKFYLCMREMLPANVLICPKVGIKDIISVSKDTDEYMSYFNKIARKHVDFVICNYETMDVICAVELDDPSHERQDRIERDELVNKIFEAAGLPLFHIKTQKSYPLSVFEPIIKEVRW